MCPATIEFALLCEQAYPLLPSEPRLVLESKRDLSHVPAEDMGGQLCAPFPHKCVFCNFLFQILATDLLHTWPM